MTTSGRASLCGEQTHRWPCESQRRVNGLGLDLDGIEVEQRKTQHVHVDKRSSNRRHADLHRHVTHIAGMQVPDGDVVCESGGDLLLIVQGKYPIDFAWACSFYTQLCLLPNRGPGTLPSQGRHNLPAHAAAFQVAHIHC
eukprot:6202795-Pleurochrysis_carterae.AAC.4